MNELRMIYGEILLYKRRINCHSDCNLRSLLTQEGLRFRQIVSSQLCRNKEDTICGRYSKWHILDIVECHILNMQPLKRLIEVILLFEIISDIRIVAAVCVTNAWLRNSFDPAFESC